MLIFVHGFLGCKEDWSAVQKALDVPSIALSLPGHERAPLDLETFEQGIPEGAIVVGYSMGGRLAMHCALKYPGKIKKLIVLSAQPGLERGIEERKKKDEEWIKLLEQGIDPFLDKWYAQPLFSSFKLTDAMKKRRRNCDPQKMIEVIKRYSPARMKNLWPELQKISSETVFLFGEDDIKYRRIGERLEKDFRCLWIPKAGHPLHLEAPEAIADRLRRLL